MEEKEEKKEKKEKKEIKGTAEDLLRIKKILPPILLLNVTLFFFGPIELYILNRGEFWFNLPDILAIILPVFLITTSLSVVILGILMKKNQKLGEISTAIVFVLGVLFYIEGNFNSVNYPILNGYEVNWSRYGFLGVLNVALWFGVFFISIYYYKVKRELFLKIVKNVSIYIVAIQLLSLGTLVYITDFENGTINAYATTKGRFELSSNENIIVFLLDTLDTEYMVEVLEVYPEVKEQYKDFTFYNDVLGAYPTSMESLPLLMTGVPFINQATYQNYKASSYEISPILETLEEFEYETSLYTYYGYIDENIVDYTENIVSAQLGIENKLGFLDKYYQVLMFRYAPHYLKQFFYKEEYDFFSCANSNEYTLYNSENLEFYEDFLEKGLSAEKEKNQYQFYYLFGTHHPVGSDENLEPLSPESSRTSRSALVNQSRGCLKMVNEFMEEMKSLGIYDSSTIIVLSDHGDCVNSDWDTDMRQCPTVLIKRPYDNHETINISSAPVSYIADWAGTMQTLVNPDGDYGTSFFNIEEGVPRERIYYYSRELIKLVPTINTLDLSASISVYKSDKPAIEFDLTDITDEVYSVFSQN